VSRLALWLGAFLTTRRQTVTITGTMDTPFLELRQLAKSYGKRQAVRGISTRFSRGEIVGLLGPNGAGKSTTITMLAGLSKPSSGDILCEGRSIFSSLRQWRRKIGIVLEDLSLFEYLGVREHLILVGRLSGLSAADAEKRARELASFFQLTDASETIASEASHGTRKKLALALSLIHAPEVLLLDEALNGIDAVTARDAKDLLKRLARRGTTIVLSSHVLDAIEPLIDRCLIVEEGLMVRDEPIERIRESGKSLEETYVEAIRGAGGPAVELAWLL
jgi:ABC-2 type transport system ATP-binding protein